MSLEEWLLKRWISDRYEKARYVVADGRHVVERTPQGSSLRWGHPRHHHHHLEWRLLQQNRFFVVGMLFNNDTKKKERPTGSPLTDGDLPDDLCEWPLTRLHPLTHLPRSLMPQLKKSTNVKLKQPFR